MEILCYCLGAALLVLTGALAAGGLHLPRRSIRRDADCGQTADNDALSRDLAALMAYGREEDGDAL